MKKRKKKKENRNPNKIQNDAFAVNALPDCKVCKLPPKEWTDDQELPFSVTPDATIRCYAYDEYPYFPWRRDHLRGVALNHQNLLAGSIQQAHDLGLLPLAHAVEVLVRAVEALDLVLNGQGA